MAIWVVRDGERDGRVMRDVDIGEGELEMRELESCACGLVSERVER